MFTIAHLSDLHLGYSSGRKKIDENGYNVRENDGYVAFNKAIDQIIEEGVNMVLLPEISSILLDLKTILY